MSTQEDESLASLRQLFSSSGLDPGLLDGGSDLDMPSVEQHPENGQTGTWTSESDGVVLEGERQRFVFRHGLTRLDLRFKDQWAILEFDAVLPANLNPKTDDGEIKNCDWLVDQFMPRLFYQLPHMMRMAHETQEETMRHYRNYSKLLLEHRSGKKDGFLTRGDKGLLQMAFGLLDANDPVTRLHAELKGDSANIRMFGLTATYPGRSYERQRLGILLPGNSKGLEAVNPTSAIWMLEQHYNSRFIGDAVSPGNQLSSLLRDRMKETFGLK